MGDLTNRLHHANFISHKNLLYNKNFYPKYRVVGYFVISDIENCTKQALYDQALPRNFFTFLTLICLRISWKIYKSIMKKLRIIILNLKNENLNEYYESYIQWGWGITGQKITGQSVPDWLKMTSPRTSKPNSGGLSRFWTIKIGGNWSDKPTLPEYLFDISKIWRLQFFES